MMTRTPMGPATPVNAPSSIQAMPKAMPMHTEAPPAVISRPAPMTATPINPTPVAPPAGPNQRKAYSNAHRALAAGLARPGAMRRRYNNAFPPV